MQSTEDRVDLHLHPAWTQSDYPAPPSPAPMFGSRLTAPSPVPSVAPPAPQPETEPSEDGFLAPTFEPTGGAAAPEVIAAPGKDVPAESFAPPEPFAPPPPSPMAPSASPAMPWQSPAIAWPETLKSVTYLGGHPGHQRKRKNGAMVFSPTGIDVSGGGFQSWSMHVDWSFVDRIEVFGADEVMFTDHMKIDGNSSAVVVQVLDGTKLYFEVRLRRPPSLRVTLAPVLTLVEDIRVDRSSF